MRKLITLTLAVLLLGLFAAVVFAAVESGDDSPSSTVGTTETTGTTRTTTTETTTPTTTEPAAPVAPQGDVDISGPCDEAEHANDPRCVGGVVGDDRGCDDHGGGFDDSSGPGPGGDDSGHDYFDDDSSGPGSGGDDSGRGRGRGGD
jgi:hypothetical protein